MHLPEATHAALAAYVESGMLAAAQDYDIGGMQLPCVIEMAANAFFAKASIAMAGYALLTSGNANLLMAHGTPRQREVFAQDGVRRPLVRHDVPERAAGRLVADRRRHARGARRRRLRGRSAGPALPAQGNKMWISAGEHELTENIVHLVLAKIPRPTAAPCRAPRASRCSSCRSSWSTPTAQLTGERNDVALAGLNHKLGYRGTTNTLLNFGEGSSRPAARRGGRLPASAQPGEGLRCMFHMMNEARIGVGLGAVMLGYAGYEASLDYARQRPQGRPIGVGGKDASQPQVPIIEHADVKRMLLAQKSYRRRRTGAGAVLRAPGRRTAHRRRPRQRARPGCCWRC